jgi:hypothetical protein
VVVCVVLGAKLLGKKEGDVVKMTEKQIVVEKLDEKREVNLQTTSLGSN